MTQQTTKRLRLLDRLGTGAYIVCVLQWFLVLTVFLPSIVQSPFFQLLMPDSNSSTVQQETPPVAMQPAEPNTAWSILGWIILVLALIGIGALIYALVTKVPRSIAKTGQTITHAPAKFIVPAAAEQFHLKKRQEIQLGDSIVLTLKLLAVTVPFVLLFFSNDLLSEAAFVAIVFLNCILFAWSLILFVLQFILSRTMKIAYQKVR